MTTDSVESSPGSSRTTGTGGQTSPGGRLRELIRRDEAIVVPGCGDALSARLIEEAGFEAAFMSGYWTAAVRGLLDIGLVTRTEMVETARYIAASISVPLICDADTGFGDGPAHIRRCVEEFEATGVAAIHLEDQTLLKKCGLMDKKRLITQQAMETKITVAVESRSSSDFVIVARTDALESEGVDGAISRGSSYLNAGADLLFVEGFQTLTQIEEVGDAFRGHDLVFNRTPAGYGPAVSLSTLQELGYAVILFPAHLLLASTAMQRALLAELRETGALQSADGEMVAIDELSRVLGEASLAELEERYGPS